MHKGKPSLGILLGMKDDKPDAEEGGGEAEDKACEELWQAIEDKDYDGFKQALNAWYDAKESREDDEEPE